MGKISASSSKPTIPSSASPLRTWPPDLSFRTAWWSGSPPSSSRWEAVCSSCRSAATGCSPRPAYITLDLSPISTVTNTFTQSSALRDLGFQFKGFFADERLQYRVAFDGERDANAHNSLRTAGYLQYDFFDREKGYLFTGTGLGKQKILAVDAGVDTQGSFRGYSANTAAAIPVNKGDEVAGQFQFFHYDGRTKFTAIPDQNDYLLEGGYYVHQAKVQPFVKYESQTFVTTANASKDINRFGLGAITTSTART